jgi:hypothetical protein
MNISSCIRCAVVGLMVCFGLSSAEYQADLPRKEVTIKEVNGTAHFTGADITGKVGQPALPAYAVSFLLPPDADFSGVKVAINGISEKTLESTYTIEPVTLPPEYPVEKDGRKIVKGKDAAVYGNNAFFPETYKGDVSFSMMAQYKVVTVIIHPYLYNPVTKKVRFLAKGKLKISLGAGIGGAADDFADAPRNAHDEESIRDIIVNPDDFKSYGTTPSPDAAISALAAPASLSGLTSLSGRKFVIYVSSVFLTTSSELNSYISTLWVRGATVSIKYPTYGTGPAAATAIRNELRGLRWLNAVTDVLFIGNPDPDDGDVPMYNYFGTPTDWYYSDLSSTFPDRIAEIRVGRIPVYGTDVAPLNKILLKTLLYLNETNVEWRRFALLPMVPCDFDVPIESYTIGEQLHTSLSADGWGTYRMYDAYNYIARNHVPDIAKMVFRLDEYSCHLGSVPGVWNRLDPGLVVWYTHGWQQAATGVLWSGSASQLDDAHPAAVIAMSCETANPNDPENLGLKTLYNNAIIYAGSTYMISPYDLVPLSQQYVGILRDNLTMGYAEALNRAKAVASCGIQAVCGFVFYGCTDVALNLPKLSTTTVLPAPELVKVEPAASPNSETAITITWTPRTGVGVTAYGIEYGDAGAIRASVFTGFANVTGEASGSYTLSGLTPGTKHKFRVYAKNAAGRSAYSRVDSASTFLGGVTLVPATPAGFYIDQTVNCATSHWTAITGTPGATGYVVQRGMTAAGPFTTVGIAIDGTATRYDDRNVINDVTYYYRVAAVNDFGISPFTTPALPIVTLRAMVPVTITGASLIGSSNTQVNITWMVNNSQPLGFIIEYRQKLPGTPGNDWTDWSEFSNRPVRHETEANLESGLEGNLDYEFRIVSFTYSDLTPDRILSTPSTSVAFRTFDGMRIPPTPTPPPAPVSLVATASPTLENILLTWSSGGAPEAEGYVVFMIGSDGKWTQCQDIEATGPSMSCDFPVGAKVTSTYCVQAYLRDAASARIYSGFSTKVTATTNDKLATPNLFLGEATHNTLSLHIGGTMNAETYDIYRSASGVSYVFDREVIGRDFSVTGLTPSTTYYFKAVAKKPGCINSDMSAAFSATTLPPPPKLEVYTRDDTYSSNQQTQVRFYIRNLAGGGSASNFVVKYYFTVEPTKTAELADYYTPNCDASLLQVSGNLWCVSMAFNMTLPPGGRVPSNDGQSFGIHYTDWSAAWNKSNDFSQPTGSSYQLNNRLAVFDYRGVLVYGSEPVIP